MENTKVKSHLFIHQISFSFVGIRGFLSTRDVKFAATDFVIVEPVGFGSVTLEEPAEVVLDSGLRMTVKLELTGLFKEVFQQIDPC